MINYGDVFIDVGASFGYYSLIVAKKVGKSGLVLVVEPNPISRCLLEINYYLNRINNKVHDNIIVVPNAL